MALALSEANAAGSHGDVPVGAVILDENDRVIARSHNTREADCEITGHAEIRAMQEASRKRGEWRLPGCTLVVTLEPCAMCAGALVQARIGRLVFGAFDDKAGAVASLWDVVRDPRLNHNPQVVSGVMAEACAGVLRDFFGQLR
ncbi:nucleoside deaminase [Propionimicrobium lymphophilum]|uniref:nucleoside deaminase n=1 Tax=Propionimicrobium lymphophilum TaxID=33012 RepID=UPI0023F0DFB1|nr:nucleoside deaminase [Propionimicrobium lymphophilum]